MKLIDLLSITSEYTDLFIIHDGNVVAWYDGRDAINQELNTHEINEIWVADNKLYVDIE